MNLRVVLAWLYRRLVAFFVAHNEEWGRADADAWLAGEPLPSVVAAAAEAERKRSLDHVQDVAARVAAAR